MRCLGFMILMLVLASISARAETVLYCQSELATGIVEENGSWRTGNFKRERYTIKFNHDYSEVDGVSYAPMTCTMPYSWLAVVHCVQLGYNHSTFRYNKETKKFVLYTNPAEGYVSGSSDTDTIEAGSCVVF